MAGMWGEINQALGNATNTAINIGQMQEQMRSRRAIEANDLERLNMDKQAFQQQQAMGDIALNKAKMEEAQMIKDKTVVPVEPFLLQRKVHPATIKAMIDDGLKAGYFNVGPGGAVTTEQGVGKQYLGVLEKDPEKNLRYETITAEAIYQDMAALKQQWQDPKLKPEQQEAISAKYAELSKQYSVHATSAQSIKAHILAKSNDKWEASFDPTAKKWVWRNAVTGEIDPNRNEVPQAAQIAASNAAEATKRAEAADASRVKAAGVAAGGKNTSSNEIETMARLLADNKLNISDISKRGNIAPKVLARALELNPSLDPQAGSAENKGFASSIAAQQKQIGSMGSFVKNMGYQINRVKEISKGLSSYDTRLLNLPLRAVRGKITGSPMQAKYDMYITEIENEIGKLATGSSASISELSVGAQQKWEKIHDKNLSIKDMISLLEETQRAGQARMDSVTAQMKDTKAEQRQRGGTGGNSSASKTAADYLKKWGP